GGGGGGGEGGGGGGGADGGGGGGGGAAGGGEGGAPRAPSRSCAVSPRGVLSGEGRRAPPWGAPGAPPRGRAAWSGVAREDPGRPGSLAPRKKKNSRRKVCRNVSGPAHRLGPPLANTASSGVCLCGALLVAGGARNAARAAGSAGRARNGGGGPGRAGALRCLGWRSQLAGRMHRKAPPLPRRPAARTRHRVGGCLSPTDGVVGASAAATLALQRANKQPP
ncbi:unnamed protein product, partial [Prorocentrum cordatum]